MCALLGKCGVGKSALAVHVAHQIREQFPDGQLYSDLGGTRHAPHDVEDALCGFLRALGVPDPQIPACPQERAAMYRSILAKRRVLVVLDDVADAEQAHRFSPAGPASAVLLTSRTCLNDLPGVRPVEMLPLPKEESVELFARIVGDRAWAEPDAVGAIVEAAGRLPLTIRAAGARIRARPYLSLTQFAGRLRNRERRLDELAHGMLDLRKRLEPSVRGLTDQARELWYELSLIELPYFTAEFAADMSGLPLPQTEKILDSLIERRLVDIEDLGAAVGAPRYRFDTVVGLYAREQARKELPATARGRTTPAHTQPIEVSK